MKRYTIIFLLLTLCAAESQAGNVLLNFQVGSGDIKIDAGESLSLRTTEFETVGGAVYGGYLFDNNLFLKGGIGYQSSEDIFGIVDSASVTSYEALFGYSLDKEGFFIRPQIGATHWRLNFKEGIFLNPGDEERIKKSGNNLLLLMDVGYAFTDRIGIRLSYKTIKLDIGRYSSSTFGLNVRF